MPSRTLAREITISELLWVISRPVPRLQNHKSWDIIKAIWDITRLFSRTLLHILLYSGMSHNPAEIKPIGTLQDFSATHMGHYQAFLFGLVGTIWDMTRIFCGTLTHFLRILKMEKISSRRVTPVSLSPRVDLGVVVFWESLSSKCFALCFSPPPMWTKPFGTLVDLSQDVRILSLGTLRGPFGTLLKLCCGTSLDILLYSRGVVGN